MFSLRFAMIEYKEALMKPIENVAIVGFGSLGAMYAACFGAATVSYTHLTLPTTERV